MKQEKGISKDYLGTRPVDGTRNEQVQADRIKRKRIQPAGLLNGINHGLVEVYKANIPLPHRSMYNIPFNIRGVNLVRPGIPHQPPPYQPTRITPAMGQEMETWLRFREHPWGLSSEMVTLVPRFFMSGVDTRSISYSMVMNLLREPARPEILPVVLRAICFRARPAKGKLDSTLVEMNALRSRDSRLLLASMSLLRSAPVIDPKPEPISETKVISHSSLHSSPKSNYTSPQ